MPIERTNFHRKHFEIVNNKPNKNLIKPPNHLYNTIHIRICYKHHEMLVNNANSFVENLDSTVPEY